jgi:hypothetical protein
MAYLIRQPSENRLRHQIDKWHDTSYSSLLVQKIQCQLEINQEHFEWNDSIDITQPLENSRCPSPTRSTHSAYSNNTNRASCYRSAASTSGWRQRGSKKPHPDKQLQVVKPVPMNRPPIPKLKQTTNSLKSKSSTNKYQKYLLFNLLFQFLVSDNHHQIYQVCQQNGIGPNK